MEGVSVLLRRMSGGVSSAEFLAERIGKVIATAVLSDNQLALTFEDAPGMAIWDEGQSCCESRYMTTDDDVNDLVGGRLMEISVRDGAGAALEPPAEDTYGEVHDVEFLKILTDKTAVTVVTHVEHNGYYGGFALTIGPLNTGRTT